MSTENNIRKQLFKTELETHKVELADSVKKLLSYGKGVVTFSNNIQILINEIEQSKKSLKVDLSDLQNDLGFLAKGIQSAEVAAKLLGVNVKEVEGYTRGLQAFKVGAEYEKLAKKFLK